MNSHTVVKSWRGERIETLKDLVPLNPKVIFVGINPSYVSVKVGHYHQGRLGKRFWRRLKIYGIIDEKPYTLLRKKNAK